MQVSTTTDTRARLDSSAQFIIDRIGLKMNPSAPILVFAQDSFFSPYLNRGESWKFDPALMPMGGETVLACDLMSGREFVGKFKVKRWGGYAIETKGPCGIVYLDETSARVIGVGTRI